jgi:adenylate kinase family enzyme
VKVAIIGNSGSGKTTLARRLAADTGAAVLDLDTIYWEPDRAVERPAAARLQDVVDFCRRHEAWIVEGCYADLIEAALPFGPALILLDPGLETCRARCRNRPLEPHKFASKEEQDRHLAFLLEWVAGYYHRQDTMSLPAHLALFEGYAGPKRRITESDPRSARA